MIQSGFFNSVSGDRLYSAADFARYFSSFVGNGVFLDDTTSLKVEPSSGLILAIAAGKAWISGYIMTSDAVENLTLDAADPSLARIDRIVVRYTVSARAITMAVKKGTAGGSPSAPALQRDGDVYELALADVTVGAGVSSIVAGNILDQRNNSAVCGAVSSVIERPDPSLLFLFFATNPILTSAWIADSTYTNYPYRAAVALEGCVNTMIPFVLFSQADVESGLFAATSNPYDGGVYIYSRSVPAATVTIPMIFLVRTVI